MRPLGFLDKTIAGSLDHGMSAFGDVAGGHSIGANRPRELVSAPSRLSAVNLLFGGLQRA